MSDGDSQILLVRFPDDPSISTYSSLWRSSLVGHSKIKIFKEEVVSSRIQNIDKIRSLFIFN